MCVYVFVRERVYVRVCVCVCVRVCARGAGAARTFPPPPPPFLWRSARAEWLEWREGRPRNGAVPPPSGAPAGRVGEGGRGGGRGFMGGALSGRGPVCECEDVRVCARAFVCVRLGGAE